MSDSRSVIEALKRTSKGQLKYDRGHLDRKAVQQILEEVSAAPKFPLYSPTSHESSEKKHEDALSTESEKETSVEKARDPVQTLNFSPHAMKIEKAIHDLETQWEDKAKSPIEERRRLFDDHHRMLSQQAEHQLLSVYIKRERKLEQVSQQHQADEQARTEEGKRKQLKLKEHHKKHAKLLDDQLREAHRLQAEELEKKKQKEQAAADRLANMVRIQNELVAVKAQVSKQISECQFQDQLPESVKKCPELLSQIMLKVDEYVVVSRQIEVNPQLIQTVAELRGKAGNVMDYVSSQIDIANKKGKEESEKKQKEVKAATEAKQVAAAAASASSAAASAAVTQSASVTSASSVGISPIVDPSAFQFYQEAQNLVKEAEKVYEALVADPRYKKVRFELQKCVNTPVNAISPNSGAHLKDKLQRICALLAGHPVEVGGKKISANEHPSGVTFCKDLFAKKIVKQADEQVSSSHDSAFAIAAVAVGVWCQFPDVGQLMMGHFYTRCPYLVPYFIPKADGQNMDDYYRSLGYIYEDGEVEKQDKFLRRMSGYMRLWASMVVSTIPPGPAYPHPQGPEKGWAWLARSLNLDPRPDITATLIYDFLEVAGHLLLKTYHKQFIKLIQHLVAEYLPRIRAVTPEGSGGPVTRLEGFLGKILSSGELGKPPGILSQNFWFT